MRIRQQNKQAPGLSGVPYMALELKDNEEENNNTSKGRQLRTAALVVSWISVIFSFITGAAAIVLGQLQENESLFGYGLDAVLDSFSSVAVLWRFYGSISSTVAEARERKACIVIAIFFFASSFSLTFKSAKTIIENDKSGENSRLLTDIFSCICGAVALVLASIKVYLGRRLDSRSLLTDSIITYVGAAMSFLGVLGLELYRTDDRVWYLDAAFGVCCGVFLLIFGLKLLIEMTCCYKRQHPVVETPLVAE